MALATGDIVGIHDSVRPFVSIDVIDACYKEAAERGSAIPIMSPKESMRQLNGDKWIAVDRSEYVFVQTPQVFSRGYLQTAYEQEYKSIFTDDASVVEASGREIHTVEGNEENIKITTPSDLNWAELFI